MPLWCPAQTLHCLSLFSHGLSPLPISKLILLTCTTASVLFLAFFFPLMTNHILILANLDNSQCYSNPSCCSAVVRFLLHAQTEAKEGTLGNLGCCLTFCSPISPPAVSSWWQICNQSLSHRPVPGERLATRLWTAVSGMPNSPWSVGWRRNLHYWPHVHCMESRKSIISSDVTRK